VPHERGAEPERAPVSFTHLGNSEFVGDFNERPPRRKKATTKKKPVQGALDKP